MKPHLIYLPESSTGTAARGASTSNAPEPLIRALVALVMLVALSLRIHNISFGLPSLWDPDEPLFMLKSLELLARGTLNPGWFGHPGSTTIYFVAAIDAAVIAFAKSSGHYPSIGEFTRAAYSNPALLLLPARIGMVLLGVLSVLLTYAVGRRLVGPSVGLIAAALLACNSLHISWSQVVRTDIHASVFMLASVYVAIGVARHGKLQGYALAGLFTGFAIATKWPAAVVFVATLGAFAYRFRYHASRRSSDFRGLAIATVAVIAGIFLASPFIFIDWKTVLANVGGEVKAGHLAQNGGGLVANLIWYLRSPVAVSMGWLGLGLSLAGAAVSWRRAPIACWTLIPAALAFLLLISSQHIIYSRWLLPALPFLCVLAAIATVVLGDWMRVRFRLGHPAIVTGAVALLVIAPSAAGAYSQAVERSNDTRGKAARWAIAHVPPGSTLLIEHLELSLRDQPWKILFPIGGGCIEGRALLSSGVGYDEVQQLRQGSPIIDIGNVKPARAATCRADFAILTYYDLYLAEAERYPAELDVYRRILQGGRTVALFRPRAGHSGGPIVRIMDLRRLSSAHAART